MKRPDLTTIKGTPALKGREVENEIRLSPGTEVLYFIDTIFVDKILDKRVVFVRIITVNKEMNVMFVPLYVLNFTQNQMNEILSKPTKFRKKDFETVIFSPSEVEEYDEVEIE